MAMVLLDVNYSVYVICYNRRNKDEGSSDSFISFERMIGFEPIIILSGERIASAMKLHLLISLTRMYYPCYFIFPTGDKYRF